MTAFRVRKPRPPRVRETYKNITIDLDFQEFSECIFDGCTLVYAGGAPPSIVGCTFKESNFIFEGAAANTIQFMAALYRGAGEGGKDLIEKTFDNIRQGNLALPEVEHE